MDADYISDLPADLKEKVLVKLPIKEVARTSILSSKWKDSWKSIPSLVLERNDREPMPVKLVDNVLMVHRGPVLEFKLSTYDNCNQAIDRWMLILYTNGIRNLQLRFWGNERCKIPSQLFSCLALERLDFSGCTINVPQFFQGFKLLRTLWLSRFDLSGINLGSFASSCPLLENLALSNFVQPGCLHILAPNLRKLHLWGEFHDLCLETPNLASGCICLSSSNRDYRKFSAAKSGNESNISRALGCLGNIRTFKICGESSDYLAMGPIPENHPTIFNHLTEFFLPIYTSDRKEIATALYLFKNAPNLKVLHIEFWGYGGWNQAQVQASWELKAAENFLFKRLETVNITHVQNTETGASFGGTKSMLQFAELVLSTAPVLQKIHITDYQDSKEYFMKLECFPRLSGKVEIVFVKTDDCWECFAKGGCFGFDQLPYHLLLALPSSHLPSLPLVASAYCGWNSLKLSMKADYLSDLPAELKEKILVKLPIKEVARTSILSSKWKDSWKSIPSLVLEQNNTESMPVNLVDNVLMVHRGPILEFKLSTYHNCNETIDRWMLILSRNGIRVLQLRFWGDERCKIPYELFSCLALECVDFSGCTIIVPQFFQGFKLLRTLWLSRFELSGISIENLVSSCPLLENLSLSNFSQPCFCQY
ncbi:hypothetical protein LUZ61_008848 [Rhynchospora tenuis]|uniref:F-box domain-containing protein n=1 Tax=Rhynchospora tenuis TaxID=198213 RepID=A0AAD5ZWC9_9POAL|nr:hypothetical protein LUZ61_008848 [Rhynchospora tenuis]